MILHNIFFRRFGVRTTARLINPVRVPLSLLELPKAGVFHYEGGIPGQVGPESDFYLFKRYTRPLFMQHVTELTSFIGGPFRKPFQPMKYIRSYHMRNKRYRILHDISILEKDQITPLSISYSLLPHMYRYQKTIMSDYQRWLNIQLTIWKNIAENAKTTKRQQYIVYKLPKEIPVFTILKRAEMEMTPPLLKLFKSAERLFILEMFKWLGHGRKNSVINAIPPEYYDKINIVFLDGGTWTIYNLGYLNNWRKTDDSEFQGEDAIISEDEAITDGIPIPQFTKFWLRGLNTLVEARNEPVNEELFKEENQELLEKDKEDEEQDDTGSLEEDELDENGLPIVDDDNIDHSHQVNKTAKSFTIKQGTSFFNKGSTNKLETELDDFFNQKNDLEKNLSKIYKKIDKELLENEKIAKKIKEKTSGFTEKTLSDVESTDVDDDEVEEDSLDEFIEEELEEEIEEEEEVVDPETDYRDEEVLFPIDEEDFEEGGLEREDDYTAKDVFEQEIDDVPDIRNLSIVSDKDTNIEESFDDIANNYRNWGLITNKEYDRFVRLSKSFKNIKVKGKTMEEFQKIDKKALEIKTKKFENLPPTVMDQSMMQSSIKEFDTKYVEEFLEKDVMRNVLNIQKAGVAITNYEVERVETIMGAYDSYAIRLTPIEGKESTVRFRLPVVDEEGNFTVNGNKYRLRKQNGVHLPIKKISKEKVALTTYYSKLFVTRGQRKRNNLEAYLEAQFKLKELPENGQEIKLSSYIPQALEKFELPRFYSCLGTFLESCQYKDWFITLNYPKRQKLISEVSQETKDRVLLGKGLDGTKEAGKLLYIDFEDNIHISTGETFTALDFFGLNVDKLPVEYADVSVYGNEIPVGFVLAYEMGFENLLKELKTSYKRIPKGKAVPPLTPDEFTLKFADETIVLTRKHKTASLILGGFVRFDKTLRYYASSDFNNKANYYNLLEENGFKGTPLKEIEMMYQLYIDPISREILEDMGEPTTFRGLLIRSCELLTNDHIPKSLDRVRGYEAFSGVVYEHLVRSLKKHNTIGKGRKPIEMNPNDIWYDICQNPAVVKVEEINPIQDLKHKEALTRGGKWGRDSQSLPNAADRAYYKEDMGLVSEATVDSSDVGINTYTSANPRFNSVRGTYDPIDTDKDIPSASLFSTSMLLSPSVDRDVNKRQNFINIQNSHVIPCVGYRAPVIRTGYESIVAHRTSSIYAKMADDDGEVVDITKEGIIVQYKNGKREGYTIGRYYGNAGGQTIPHHITTTLTKGDKFNKGDPIVYNDGFFERDFLNPKNIVWKSGINVRVAVVEDISTYEDSSSITKRTAELLGTSMTKVENIMVNFDNSIHNLPPIGTKVKSTDTLCIIEDPVFGNMSLLDENSMDTLRTLSAMSPKAKNKGVIERIEIFYNGEKEDMSDSLRALVVKSDKELASRFKAAGKKVFSGRVDSEYRVDGEPLMPNQAVIKFYITDVVGTGIGDFNK